MGLGRGSNSQKDGAIDNTGNTERHDDQTL